MYEALTRHLIQSGRNHGITLKNVNHLLKAIRDPTVESSARLLSLDMLMVDADFTSYVEELFSHIEGPDNHLAQYIVSLMEMIETLFMNIDSIRTHNWDAYLDSLRLMLPWLEFLFFLIEFFCLPPFRRKKKNVVSVVTVKECSN